MRGSFCWPSSSYAQESSLPSPSSRSPASRLNKTKNHPQDWLAFNKCDVNNSILNLKRDSISFTYHNKSNSAFFILLWKCHTTLAWPHDVCWYSAELSATWCPLCCTLWSPLFSWWCVWLTGELLLCIHYCYVCMCVHVILRLHYGL